MVQARDAVPERGGRAAAGLNALVADKAPQATRKQAIDLQATILVALRKRDGAMVVGVGARHDGRLGPRPLTELQSRVSATG